MPSASARLWLRLAFGFGSARLRLAHAFGLGEASAERFTIINGKVGRFVRTYVGRWGGTRVGGEVDGR